ncbi:hypothetical protein Hgul01_02522 [Herpetosiphon gulosus]|uniref:Uncharacterized protein n=1 Tax=Herpetosiphon gulosus TaxID=1973496 RepID=A0ABP9WZY8_9CHLR
MIDFIINGLALVGENQQTGEVKDLQFSQLPRQLVGDK